MILTTTIIVSKSNKANKTNNGAWCGAIILIRGVGVEWVGVCVVQGKLSIIISSII